MSSVKRTSVEARDAHNGAEDTETPSFHTTHSNADTMATSVEPDTGAMLKDVPSTNTCGGIGSVPTEQVNSMAEAPKKRIMYRVEWRYEDGEIAHEKEGHDEANLFINHPTPVALPPITITTVFRSTTTKERSKKKKKEKSEDKKVEKGKDTTENQSEASNEKGEDTHLEDFANSRASRKRMTIHSKKLVNALRDVVTYCPYSLVGDDLVFDEPYQILYHHMKDLRDYRNYQPPWHDEIYRNECNQDLDTLLDFLDDRYGTALRDEEARWARPTPVCTFEYLWLLFKPGETCYEVDDDQINPFITQEPLIYSDVDYKVVKYEIVTWNIDFDGYLMGRCENYVYLLPFDGEREIRSLKYYPTRFYKESQESIEKNDGKTFYQTLVARGRKFWDLAKKGNCYQEYSGESAERPHKKVFRAQLIPRYLHHRTYFVIA